MLQSCEQDITSAHLTKKTSSTASKYLFVSSGVWFRGRKLTKTCRQCPCSARKLSLLPSAGIDWISKAWDEKKL